MKKWLLFWHNIGCTPKGELPKHSMIITIHIKIGPGYKRPVEVHMINSMIVGSSREMDIRSELFWCIVMQVEQFVSLHWKYSLCSIIVLHIFSLKMLYFFFKYVLQIFWTRSTWKMEEFEICRKEKTGQMYWAYCSIN